MQSQRMGKPLKVGFATKLLSNRNYLKEVSVEGKTTNKFNFNIGYYDQYAAQIIRSGNCITLLSNEITITKETFWNPNHFEDITRYVFWTFNKSFLFILIENVDLLTLPTANRCALLLRENFTPYSVDLEKSSDEELRWCVVQNKHLIEDPNFEQMYALDKENRSALLDALALRITPNEAEQKEEPTIPADVIVENKKSFIFRCVEAYKR